MSQNRIYTACQNKPKPGEGPSGYWAMDGEKIIGEKFKVFNAVRVEHTMSNLCRYDRSDTDPGCKGCTYPKDEEYIATSRGKK